MTIATKKIADSVILATLLVLLALPSCSWAQNTTEKAPETRTEALPMTEELPMSSEATDMADEALVAESEKQADKRRETILAEATEALKQTEQALKALEEERIEDALSALAVTTGKLELIVAREPDLALAPTDVSVTYRDILASNDDIERVIDSAEAALDDGRVQDARRLLNGMGSEIVTTVTELPLVTYAAAIKKIAPLIDAGEIKQAKQDLETVLQTVVLTDYVTPLPYVRAEQLLKRAEELAEMSDRSEKQNDELASQLAEVRKNLELGELLGYGNTDSYESLHDELDQIEEKTSDGKQGKGIFDKLRSTMSELWTSVTS